LKLRKSAGNQYLDAQVFAGAMYIGGAVCMFAIRAWKLDELDKMSKIHDFETVEMGQGGAGLKRTISRVSTMVETKLVKLRRLTLRWVRA